MKQTLIKFNRHKEFKEYPRAYEYVFKNMGEYYNKRTTPVTLYKLNKEEFIDFTRGYAKYWDKILWGHVCTLFWIESRLKVGDKRKNLNTYNNIDGYWAHWYRENIGMDHKSMSCGSMSMLLKTYVKYFYKNIGELDYTELDFDFPYNNISVSHLFLVYQMPERMELLKIAEERKMEYWDFIEYIINYISSYNSEFGRQYKLTDKASSTYFVQWSGYENKPK